MEQVLSADPSPIADVEVVHCIVAKKLVVFRLFMDPDLTYAIALRNFHDAPRDFHSRFSAVSKTYARSLSHNKDGCCSFLHYTIQTASRNSWPQNCARTLGSSFLFATELAVVLANSPG